MHSLMQDWPLTVDRIIDHAARWHADREVVSRSVEGPIVRTTYGEIHGRARRLSGLLASWGVTRGDRIAVLAWNTWRHMETWYGIMGMGAVCHTLNPRLPVEQLAWMINHAEDRILFADACFAPLIALVAPHCPGLSRIVYLTDAEHLPDGAARGEDYETLLAGQARPGEWGGFDEKAPCGLCYTSGTTGLPKGVLYSHRSNFLHTLIAMQQDVLGGSSLDSVLMVVPMFHANGWGLAFLAPAAGAKLVLPGPRLDGASIHELLESEKVTQSAAVPTVWQMLLGHMEAEGLKLSTLRRVVIGGAACPQAMIRAYHDRYGVTVVHAWGMTEMSPLGTTAGLVSELAEKTFDERLPYLCSQGRPPIGVELRIADEEGRELPRDGEARGALQARGPAVVRRYFREDHDAVDADGYFDTGDVATIDPLGYVRIVDRAKDIIKSGGEWISSIDIENIVAAHPAVARAAVIAMAHAKWGERPLLVLQLRPGAELSRDEILGWLSGRITKWWMPDDVAFVDEIPLGATGKIDKKRLRADLLPAA